MKWLPVVDYEDRFEVSDTGQIRSLDSHQPGKIRRLQRDRAGYLMVTLYKYHPPQRLFTPVQRIVAKAFIPNPRNLPEVNHKDGNKENNHVSNLEWTTSRENKKHAVNMGLGYIGEHNSHAKLTSGQVLSIRSDNRSGADIAREYGVQPAAISKIKLGRTWRHI